MSMSDEVLTSIERFEKLLSREKQYSPEAFNFVYEALDWTLHNLVAGPPEPTRHVDGPQLLEGIRRYALERFGPLTATVFAHWGVRKTDDWGEIVFTLIEYDLMGKNETDRKEDFSGVYDFNDAFNVEPAAEYDPASDIWHVTYVPAKPSYERSHR